MASLTPDQKRAVVGERVLQLFSGNEANLASLKSLAEGMIDMPGIESFFTPLPWSMQLADGRVITGNAENLRNAVKDIFNQINFLIKTYPVDMKASLSIDEKRLAPRLSKIIGGA